MPKRPGRPGPARGPAAPSQRGPRETAAPAPAAPADAAVPAAPSVPAEAAAPVTPQVQLIPAAAEGALDAADEAVDLLLDTGRAPADILVLTMGEQHPWATHELSFGEASYWAQHDAREDVFYAAAPAAGRAAGRPVVVLAVNGGEDAAATRALADAMAKADSLLIVCGDPQLVNSLAGAGV